MKYISAVLALFGWSIAKADRLVIVDQAEFQQLQSNGLVKLTQNSNDSTIEVNPDLMDALNKMGRVKQIRTADPDNCTGTGGGCEYPDNPK